MYWFTYRGVFLSLIFSWIYKFLSRRPSSTRPTEHCSRYRKRKNLTLITVCWKLVNFNLGQVTWRLTSALWWTCIRSVFLWLQSNEVVLPYQTILFTTLVNYFVLLLSVFFFLIQHKMVASIYWQCKRSCQKVLAT